MGLSKSKTTTGPSKAALPKINQASDAVTAAYNDNKANLGKITSGFSDAFDTYKAGMGASDPTLDGVRASLGSAFDRYSADFATPDPSVTAMRAGLDDSFSAYKAGMGRIDPTITAAKSRLTDVLGGKFLSGNPELDNIIKMTNASTADDINARFSMSGQTGSSRQIGELGKRLSENESALRYKNYADEQARIDAAVGAASSLDAQQAAARNAEFTTLGSLGSNISDIAAREAATRNAGITTMAGVGSTLNGMEDSEAARKNAEIDTLIKLGGTAATLPYSGADFLASGLGGLWGSSQTTKSSQGLGTSLMGLAGSALGGWAGGGFKGI